MWDENKVRIIDIANDLGVSTATVSNVLHGKTKKISDATIKRVEQKLEESGYIHNMAATLLARNNSRIIGVVVNNHEKYEGRVLEDPFISSAINYLSDEIENAGYFMMLKKAKEIMDAVRFSSMWNLDGLIIIGFCEIIIALSLGKFHSSVVIGDIATLKIEKSLINSHRHTFEYIARKLHLAACCGYYGCEILRNYIDSCSNLYHTVESALACNLCCEINFPALLLAERDIAILCFYSKAVTGMRCMTVGMTMSMCRMIVGMVVSSVLIVAVIMGASFAVCMFYINIKMGMLTGNIQIENAMTCLLGSKIEMINTLMHCIGSGRNPLAGYRKKQLCFVALCRLEVIEACCIQGDT